MRKISLATPGRGDLQRLSTCSRKLQNVLKLFLGPGGKLSPKRLQQNSLNFFCGSVAERISVFDRTLIKTRSKNILAFCRKLAAVHVMHDCMHQEMPHYILKRMIPRLPLHRIHADLCCAQVVAGFPARAKQG